MDDIRTPKDALDFLDTVEKTLSGPLVFKEKPAEPQVKPQAMAPEKPIEGIREPRIPMEAPEMLINHPEVTLTEENLAPEAPSMSTPPPSTPDSHYKDPETFLGN